MSEPEIIDLINRSLKKIDTRPECKVIKLDSCHLCRSISIFFNDSAVYSDRRWELFELSDDDDTHINSRYCQKQYHHFLDIGIFHMSLTTEQMNTCDQIAAIVNSSSSWEEMKMELTLRRLI